MSDPSSMSDAEIAAEIARLQVQSSQAGIGTSPQSGDAPAQRLPDGSYAVTVDRATGDQQPPHTLSDAELAAEIAKLTPSDALHSLGPGLGKAAAVVAGLPGDALNLWHGATDFGGDVVQELMHGGPLGMKPADSPSPWIASTEGPMSAIPDSGAVNNRIQKIAGPYYQPQTWAGRAVDALPSFAISAALPGGLGARVSRALVPFAVSDTAGEVTRGMRPGDAGAEALARGIGGFAGGVGQGLGEGVLNAPQAALAKAMNGADPQTLDDLQRLLTSSRNLPGGGITLTPAEAGAQVGIPQLARLQHFVENTPQGAAQLGPFFARRPGQVSSVTNALADALAPPRPDPSMLGVDTQNAADGSLGFVRRSINEAADPYYAALRGQSLPPDVFDQLRTNPSFTRAMDAFRDNPELSASFEELPDNDLSVLNEVKKQLDTMARTARPGEFNPEGNHQLEAARETAAAALNAAGRDASTDWATALDTVARGRRQLLEPLQAGPLGAVAQTADFPTQSGALFQPRNVGGADETRAALGHIANQDTALPPQIVSQYLRNMADSALANLQGGANEWGGARLGVRLAGSPERRAALTAGVDAAGGDTGQLADYLDALGATGKRLPVGSRTAFNQQMADELGMPAFRHSITDPLEWGAMINSAVGGALYRHRIGSLADFLSSGDAGAQRAFLDQAQGMRGTNAALANALISARAGSEQP